MIRVEAETHGQTLSEEPKLEISIEFFPWELREPHRRGERRIVESDVSRTLKNHNPETSAKQDSTVHTRSQNLQGPMLDSLHIY